MLFIAGFTIYHLSEKYIYIHVIDRKSRLKGLQEFHLVGFVVDNAVIGIFLYVALQSFSGNATVLFLPFLFHVISASILLNHATEKFSIGWPYFLALSAVLPASTLAAQYLYFSERELFALLPFLTGFLLYFVVRDALPKGRLGKPLYFALGVAVVAALLNISPLS